MGPTVIKLTRGQKLIGGLQFLITWFSVNKNSSDTKLPQFAFSLLLIHYSITEKNNSIRISAFQTKVNSTVEHEQQNQTKTVITNTEVVRSTGHSWIYKLNFRLLL